MIEASFEVTRNLSTNEGQFSGLFVVQQGEIGLGVRKALEEGLHELDRPDCDPKLMLVPVIADEYGSAHFIHYLKEYDSVVGSIATFGADQHFEKGESRTHLEIIAHEKGRESPDYLTPLLKRPRNLFRNRSREDIRDQLQPFHLKLGTITVEDSVCSLRVE